MELADATHVVAPRMHYNALRGFAKPALRNSHSSKLSDYCALDATSLEPMCPRQF